MHASNQKQEINRKLNCNGTETKLQWPGLINNYYLYMPGCRLKSIHVYVGSSGANYCIVIKSQTTSKAPELMRMTGSIIDHN